MRLRFGAETKVLDNLKVGFRLVSGGNNPRSTNQTFEDSFSSKGINLDWAYAEYKATDCLTLVGGKFKNPIWRTSDLMWDTDISPEGAAAQFNYKASDGVYLFANTGFFILDESSSDTSDLFMYVFQPGLEWKINKTVSMKSAVAYYGFSNVKGSALDYSAKSNTGATTGLKYDYNSFAFSSELGIKPGIIFYLGIFGDYVHNIDPSDDNNGWLIGLKFGEKKVNKRGQWQAKYLYRRLERDAVLDIFPEADLLSGQTNVKGHEAILEYGLAKNMVLALDYYHTEQIHGSIEEDLFQFDWKVKFP
ncbi:MAG: putative porin [Proteobacteria bacterium]|nr:putative porin [Pseudomonadota bacterium]